MSMKAHPVQAPQSPTTPPPPSYTPSDTAIPTPAAAHVIPYANPNTHPNNQPNLNSTNYNTQQQAGYGAAADYYAAPQMGYAQPNSNTQGPYGPQGAYGYGQSQYGQQPFVQQPYGQPQYGQPQFGYGPQGQYVDNKRSGSSGVLEGLLAACACCCCLELLF